MDLGLNGKTAIVTGGSGVIGQGLVLGFAAEGANVVCADRDLTRGLEIAQLASQQGLPGRVLAIGTDITDRSSIDAMMGTCHAEFGPVDVLVNNAGGARMPARFEELGDDAFDWELALNIKGTVYVSQAASKDFSTRGGAVVNISSSGGHSPGSADLYVNYASAKGYVLVLTKALASAWSEWGVRVNAICPGLIAPEFPDEVGEGSLWRRFGFDSIVSPDQLRQARAQSEATNTAGQSHKRLGRPDDIANLALFLASDKASYITGQSISVSGGSWMP